MLGEPVRRGPIVVGERGGVVHDAGLLQAFVADLLVHGEVEFLEGGLRLGPWAAVGISGGGGGWGGFLLLGLERKAGCEEGEGGEEQESGETSCADVHLRCGSSGRKTRVQEKDRVQGAGSRVQQSWGLGAGSGKLGAGSTGGWARRAKIVQMNNFFAQ